MGAAPLGLERIVLKKLNVKVLSLEKPKSQVPNGRYSPAQVAGLCLQKRTKYLKRDCWKGPAIACLYAFV